MELDFSEEDVEFADRSALQQLVAQLKEKVTALLQSFRLGNVIKNGVSVAIIGKPNAGKSTLLNALLNEERAIVSDIAGTTRDTIEEILNINGVLFRLIDTAGIREHSTDAIENQGIERSKQNAAKAHIILLLTDAVEANDDDSFHWLEPYRANIIRVRNKVDLLQTSETDPSTQTLSISAKEKTGIETLKLLMYQHAVGDHLETENTIITNARHQEALQHTLQSLWDIEQAMAQQVSGELLALDIRRCLYFLGSITGNIELDRDILGAIFSQFCIGK